MNPDKRKAEKQWQRESFGTEGRQMAPTQNNTLDTTESGDMVALFDGDKIVAGKEAWIQSDMVVDVR